MTALLVAGVSTVKAQFYVQTNLVSDLPGLALVTDTNLVGAWGTVHSATTPWWVNTTFSGRSLVINGAGQPQSLVVTIPPTNGATATGIVFNGGTNFVVVSNLPARFIFATLNGTISGWSPMQPHTAVAVLMVNNSGSASYSGLALAQNQGQDFLYAANFLGNEIDVFDGNFKPVSLPAGSFVDPRVPPGLATFNVQLVGDWLYVTYAPTNALGPGTGAGRGRVDVFDVNGVLHRRLEHGFWMNAPWGVTQAPADFGVLGNRLLVGMFGSGAIAAFDAHGRFRGFMRDTDGLPLVIAKGLWGIGFGNGGGAGATNVLYFASDVNLLGHFHGLFGTLTPVPGPPEDHDMGNDNGEDQNQQ